MRLLSFADFLKLLISLSHRVGPYGLWIIYILGYITVHNVYHNISKSALKHLINV